MNNDVELIPVKGVLPSVQVQSDNVIYVPQAHKNKAGIVKEGDGVLIENGVVSLNKQTVEDMIDANKWVSYGFEQNLTEDEKGMARHNIGAGDNDFTGSYYDVTQKPHLNTDNSASLPVGDEEINNTVILHKISKTGSFNNLNDVPHETLDFAESERQKSKNLFNINNGIYKGALTTSGGLATANNVSFSINNETITLTTDTYDWRGIHSEYFKLKGNTVYTLSYSRSDVVAFLVCFYDSSYTFISSVYEQGNTQKTFTVPTNTAYVRFGIQNTSVGTVTISNIQIEEGTVATDYQPYNGEITHNGDAPVVFAESERQKSKNLCCLKNESATVAGVTMIYDSINQTIELNGTSAGDINIFPDSRTILPTISNSLGKTYTITIIKESGNFSENFGVFLGSLDSDIWSDRFTLWVNKGNTSSSVTFTVSTNHTYDTLFVYLLSGTVVNNLKLKVQIEEGSVVTDFQSYNGAIVHEKQIADVEHVETIYDMNTKNTIGGTAYTAGIPFSNISISNVNFNKYKYLRFTCRWNEHPNNWYGGTITFDLDLKTPYNADTNYISVISNRPSNCYAIDSILTYDLVGFVKVNINKNGLDVLGYKITYTGERTAYTPDNYLTYFRIEKIEGVY